MYAVTDRFLQAIQQGGKRKTVVDVYYGSSFVPVMMDVPVIGGSLKIDRNSRSRRSGNITVGDPELFPKITADSQINPYGTEIVIRTGFVYANNDEELIPMGVFGIDDISGDDSTGLFPEVVFYDRAQRVFDMSTHVADSGPQLFGGEYTTTAIETTVEGAAPGWFFGSPLWMVTFEPGLQDIKIPKGFYDGDSDRWKMAEDLALSMGGEIFFDRIGTPIVRPTPTISQDTLPEEAVWTCGVGENTGVLMTAARKVTRQDTYNSVVMLGATGSDNKPQAISVVYDLDPRSKTYYNGPFGKKTLRVSNSALTSDVACLIAATEKLRSVVGLSRTLTFDSISNPALDAGDVIKVEFLDGTYELHLVESIDLDLFTGKMTIGTRSTQYVE